MQAPQPVRMCDPSNAPWYFQTSRAVQRPCSLQTSLLTSGRSRGPNLARQRPELSNGAAHLAEHYSSKHLNGFVR